MKLFLMIFALAISFFGCAESVDKKDPADPDVAGGMSDYLALGDSYTIGQSVPESDRWPVLLVKLLREDSVRISDAKIIARTGWTTAELASAIAQDNDKKTYKLVSLLIGVNNQYRGQSIERYRPEFKELLVASIAFAAGKANHVVVLSIPDWGATPYGGSSDNGTISKEIDVFNLVAKEEALAAGVHFVDITPVSRTALNDRSLVASDGLHYSGKMHKLWAERVVPIARSLVK
jgi:lysophospholipase L1-like esterase